MENNENVIVKQKSNKGVIVILIILVLGLCTYIAYDKFVLEKDTKTTNEIKDTTTTNTTDETKNDNTTVETKNENVPTTDLSHLYYESSERGIDIFYAYINDGKLYYYSDRQEADGNKEGRYYDFVSNRYIESNENDEKIKEYSGLNNIKRMKLYNTTTGVDPSIFIITEDGIVYRSSIHYDINLKQVEELKDYKVDDLLDYSHGDSPEADYKVILKDGTTKDIHVKY